ncbi:hypothetical protein [Bradyrhizobium sp. JYMT SZCCT0428]|uniref:hypothetical protein n=1 Tax=Bradyrhizobium sp. JYMT SZCCT0428 TaxID=2807673 RepID=UPI001BAA4637|nr:hypothetical protein [Bradyrhizobium sp. JYMT SZCCT0428]MBR1156221.1 hypothetical protein [Bradyrhizobium sp. JYMT SZCCT0428]
MFGWFNSESRERRKKVRLDRTHLEERARRFLKSYLEADEARKHQFYRAVEDVSKKCHQGESLSRTDIDDARIAENTSRAAMQLVLDRAGRLHQDDRLGNFVTDACATVAIAYQRAAGVYVDDKEMQQLGTAAVHLLTMATSHTTAHED